MDPTLIVTIVKSILDGLVTLLTNAGQDPKETIVQLLDEHPLLASADKDIDDAFRKKFGEDL